MNSTNSLTVLFLTGLCFCLPSYCVGNNNKQTGADSRPNILFVFSDDHACQAIGAYDDWLKPVNPTPNIDRLAKQGMLFKNSFCTNSICGPSRAVILTGKFSHLNGFMTNGNNFDGSQQTFPKLMRKAGYATAMIGKWHLNSSPQGFDYWDVLRGQGDYYNPVLLTKDGKRQVEGYCTDIVTDLAIDWLKENSNDDKPFMLMCQHKAPHRCWMPPIRHLDLYNDIELPEPATLFDKQTDNAQCIQLEEMELDRHMHLVNDLFAVEVSSAIPFKGNPDGSGLNNLKKMTPKQLAAWTAAFESENQDFAKAELSGQDLIRWKHRRYIKNYLRCVRGVDDSVGQLMKYLEESGLSENTIVIYCSDQGFFLGDHGWYDKRFMYEESLKMPLIVKWPGVTKPASVNRNLVQNLDYAETFLDIAGAEIPADMQGQSLVPLLKGQQNSPTWRDAIYYHYYQFPSVHMVARHYGVRDSRYKLIHFYQFDQLELYDLQEDPDELTNQYANPNYAGEIKRLKKRLVELRQEYRDDSDVSVQPKAWQDKFWGGLKKRPVSSLTVRFSAATDSSFV